MRKLLNYLPAIAAIFAAVAALAFNEPRDVLASEYGEYQGEWYEVTGLMPGPNTYVCNQPVTETCTFDQPSTSANEIKEGVFEVTGNLEPIE